MLELDKYLKELSKKLITPDFLARENNRLRMGNMNIVRANDALASVHSALTDEETRLADIYETLFLGGQRTNMSAEGEQRLVNQIAIIAPGAKEAFEKRERLFDEAFQPLESDRIQEGVVI